MTRTRRILLTFLLAIAPAWAVPAIVGTPASHKASGGNTNIITVSAPSAANVVFVLTCLQDSTKTVTGISGVGATWTKTVSSTVRFDCEIWKGLSNSGSGTSVTVTSSAGTFGTAFYYEVSGMNTSAPEDQSSSNNGNNTTVTSGSVTTTLANEIIFVVCNAAGNLSAPTNSFNAATTPDNTVAGLSRIVSSTGTYNAGMTNSTFSAWECETASYKAASAAASAIKHYVSTK